MSTRFARSIALPMLFALGACAAPQPHHSAADLSAAGRAVGDRFLEAFNKADVDGVMATYWHSPELVYFGLDGMGMRGWDAVRADMVATFQMLPHAKFEFLERHDDPHGDVVVGWGTWRVTVPGASGAKPTVLEGRFTDLKAFRDGKWVYILDHPSVPMAAPK